MKLAFRPMADWDKTFVISSWLDAHRSSYSAGLWPMHIWHKHEGPIREWHLSQPNVRTLVAYEATDPEFLYGWVAADPTEQRVPSRDGSVRYWPALVLFVFVKQSYRREGIARALFDAVGVDPSKPFVYSCNTVTASRLASKVPLARFDPLVARFPKESNAARNDNAEPEATRTREGRAK